MHSPDSLGERRPLDHICKERLCLRKISHLGGLLDIRRDELLGREPAIAHARIPACCPTGSKVIQPIVRCHGITGIDGRRCIVIVRGLQKRQLGRAYVRIQVASPVAQRDKRTCWELVGAQVRLNMLAPPTVGSQRHQQIQRFDPQVVAIDKLLRLLVAERAGVRNRHDLWFRIPKARVRDVCQERQRSVM